MSYIHGGEYIHTLIGEMSEKERQGRVRKSVLEFHSGSLIPDISLFLSLSLFFVHCDVPHSLALFFHFYLIRLH